MDGNAAFMQRDKMLHQMQTDAGAGNSRGGAGSEEAFEQL
jgi:hypothetical protein